MTALYLARGIKMFSDLLMYTTPRFQHAHMVLALLQLTLKKVGLAEDAQRLEGLDLTNTDMATTALVILRKMNPQPREARQVHCLAVQAVQEAILSSNN